MGGMRNVSHRFIKDLIPPILLRLLRRKRSGPPVTSVARPLPHRVTGGVLEGRSLQLDVSRSAFRQMGDGSYDAFMWGELPSEPGAGCILDIGAHIGYHALAFAVLYPGRQVKAFEPNPVNLERLHANLALEPDLAERIEVLACALGDVNGELGFNASSSVDDQTSSGGYLDGLLPPLDAGIYERSGFQRSVVGVRRLDDLVEERSWEPVALMKIDVEGAEHLVVEGGLQVIRRDLPVLCIEVHSVVCMLALGNLLQPLGYRIDLLQEDRPSRAHIIARPPGLR